MNTTVSNLKNFDLNKAFDRNQKVVTKYGNRVVPIIVSRNKLICNVYESKYSVVPRQIKYNLDGTLHGKNYPNFMDLFMVA